MSLTKTLAAVAAALLMVSAGGAMAKSNKTAATKAQTPESLECSKEADAKGLHGKERKEFRAKCKKDAEAKKTDASKPADTSKSSTDKKS